MKCEKCGKEMLRSGLYWFCGEHDPPLQVAVSGLQESGKPWHLLLAADGTLWYEEAFESFPSVIAHEYNRLLELFNQGQVYGVLLQLKDLFEVLIKFPVLVSAAESYGKKERDEIGNRLLALLLQKPLNLGDWQEAAALCIKQKLTPQLLDTILADILTIFTKHNIVNWRNKEIGHGALSFAETEEFKEDISKKLELICSHFKDNASSYRSLHLYIHNGAGKTTLKGKEKGRGIEHTDARIYFALPRETEAAPLDLFPYLLLDEKGIYFFDSRDRRKQDSYLLNYPEGKKKNRHPEVNSELEALSDALEKNAHLAAVAFGGSHFDGEGHAAVEEAVLNRLAAIDDFQRPDYLVGWLNKALQEHDRGVLLLQMERGTGKSTFARALDQLSMAKQGLLKEKFTVRAYYINDTFACKLEKYAEGLADALRKDNHNQPVVSAAGVLDYNSAAPKEEMARFLNRYHAKRREIIGGEPEKLLLIIDGLDEIPPPQVQSLTIFNFIPDPMQLNENLYLLLTSRTNEELKGKSFTLQAVDKLVLKAHGVFHRRAELENVEVMRAYITAQLAETFCLDEDQTALLLEKAQYRFLHLKLLKEMLKLTRLEEIEAQSSSARLMVQYLTLLAEMYGSKYFNTLMEHLIVLSILPEPVTITELALLLGETRAPNFRLLAGLADLRGFLTIERSYRGNLLSIAHEGWKQVIKKNNKDRIMEKVANLGQEALCLVESELPWHEAQCDGETYLLAWIWILLEEYTPYIKKEFLDIRIGNNLEDYADKLSLPPPVVYLYERSIKTYEMVLSIKRELVLNDNLKSRESLAEVFMKRAKVLHELTRYEEAHINDNLAVKIISELDDANKLSDRICLAKVFNSRAVTSDKLTHYEEALKDCDLAVEIIFDVDVERLASKQNFIAKVFNNRAIVLKHLKRYQEALENYNKSVHHRRELYVAGNLNDGNDLAKVLINRADTLRYLSCYKEALMDCDQALEIIKELYDKGILLDNNYMARALSHRAESLNCLTRYEESLVDCDMAVKIRENLYDVGKLPDIGELAKVLEQRANTLQHLTCYDEALADYDKALKIREELDEACCLPDRNYLATVLMNRGLLFKEIENMAAALEDFNACAAILETIPPERRFEKIGRIYKLIVSIEKGFILHRDDQLKITWKDD